jgi:hypothetical protein
MADDQAFIQKTSNRMQRTVQYGQASTDALMYAIQAIESLDDALHADSKKHWESILIGQGLITIWSTVEVCLRDILIEWLLINRAAWKSKRIADLKISIADWEAMDRRARATWIVASLWRTIGTAEHNPIGRFATLFDALDVPRALPDSPYTIQGDTGRLVIELWAIRNVIVHRMGVIDAKFCADCPHFSGKEGEPIVLTMKSYGTYANAAIDFLQAMIMRIRETGKLFVVDR